MYKSTKTNRQIFGVSLENPLKNTTDVAEDLFQKALQRQSLISICSLNPEILLKAHSNPEFTKTLNGFDEKIIDGFGLQMLLFFKKKWLTKRFAGADLSEKLLYLAEKKQLKIGVVIKKGGLSKKRDVEFFLKNKQVDFMVFEKGIDWDNKKFFLSNRAEFEKIEILFVFLGAPQQEAFLRDFENMFSGPRIGICAGGTIDFWTGKKIRAPKLLQVMGLEWFWRFLNQPNRFFRIWRAVLVFPLKVFFEKTDENTQSFRN